MREKAKFKASVQCPKCSHQWMRKPSEIERLHGVSNAATLSIKEILYLLCRKCAGCGRGFKSIEDATIDHVIPKSKGGEDNWRNYQLMHEACNKYKSNKLPSGDELHFLEQLSTRHRKEVA